MLKALAGTLVLGLALYDLVITVIAPKGAGPLTDRLCRIISRSGRKTYLRTGWICLVAVVSTWPLLLWFGWGLIFLSAPDSVIASTTGAATGAVEKLYFVGYGLSTLGLGDYTPSSDGWRLVTNLVSFSGLGTITLAITYIIPVLSAATEKRQLADLLHDLFHDSESIADTERLLDRIDSTVWPQLTLHTERHLAYPILHNFRAQNKNESLAVGLLKMHKALETLPPAATREIVSAIDRFLTTLECDFVSLCEVESGGSPYEQRDAKIRTLVKEWE